jgi:SNF2 family DNA or RNA helicase
LLSIKLVGNILELKVESDPPQSEFKRTIDVIKEIPGKMYNVNTYTWTIPKEQIDLLLTKIDGITRLIWHTPLSTIKDEHHAPVLPDFKVSDGHLDDLLLRPYPFQTIGISFLHDVEQCMIADEMGLGKTIQIIGAVWRLYCEGKITMALIICPASLKYQWADEIGKFLGQQTFPRVVDGTTKQREKIYKEIAEERPLFTIVNYELVRNDIDSLVAFNFGCIALDEAHRIKNWASKTSEAIKQLDAPYKFASTGTPMQNKPEEIYNVFSWINPKILGTWRYFVKRYIVIGNKFKRRNVVLGYDNLDELHDKLSKFMLRRLKSEVAPELPEMLINDYLVPMTDKQTKLHEQVWDSLFDLVKEVGELTEYNEFGQVIKEHPKAGQILGMFTMLQEICDAPELLSMSDSRMAKHYIIDDKASPKLDELERIIADILENDEKAKIVIFTQFERMQRLVAGRLKRFGKTLLLNGAMSAVERQKTINEFTMGDGQFFISTDAGNYGINLQCAKVLINIDLPWNPAVYEQRCGRIHRIGSAHEVVNVINLISAEGLDERILDTLYKKKAYSNIVVEKNAAQAVEVGKLTASLMKDLLKRKKKRKGTE